MNNQSAKTPKEILYGRYGDLFDFANEAVKKNPEILRGQNCNTLSKAVTVFHSVRATYLLSAINILCKEGYATEAMSLLRSLLNLFIDIKWLTTGDSEARMVRFKDFEVVFKKLSFDDSIDCGYPLDNTELKKYNELTEEFEQIKKKYGLKKKHELFKWSGESISAMAKKVGLKKDDKIVYGRLSKVEHTAPNSPGEYLDWSENGEVIMYSGPRDKKVTMVLISALSYFYQVKEIVHNILELDRDSLEKENQRLVGLANKYWGNKDK